MIQISGVKKSFGARDLFRGADLRIGARDRLALLGPNGAGKTTLFDMIAKLQEPDEGRIDVGRGVTLGYLSQHTDALRGRSALEEVLSAGSAVAQAGHRLEVLNGELADTTDDAERDRLLAEYARLQDHFETLGGYSLDAQARTICAGLGFREGDLERRTEELSGGWLMRVALAKLLLSSPDVLLLDEPTNHLDLESVRWLEMFLTSFEGACLLISHDRDFINGFANRIVEIENGKLMAYTGNYQRFVEQREMRIQQSEAAAAQQQRKIAQNEKFIERFRYKNTKAKQVQSRIKMLEKLDKVEIAGEKRRVMGFGLPPAPRAGRVVIELESVDFSYGDLAVYSGLDIAVERAQKIALVGPNGAGKSTLLKLLAGALQPQSGARTLGTNVELGYFAQHQIDALDMNARVFEEVDRMLPPGSKVRARDVLGRFLFSGEDADKPVRVLSGGERTRLALAKILASARNVLCLDEPTNHLDMWSRDALEDALDDFDGAIILITHDRHLIRQVADTIIEVIDGRVRMFPGDYDSYLAKVAADEAVPVRTGATVGVAGTTPPAKERRKAAAEERARASSHRNKVRSIERELDAVHTDIKAMEERMADPGFYTGTDDLAGFMKRYDQQRERVKALESTWDSLTAESS